MATKAHWTETGGSIQQEQRGEQGVGSLFWNTAHIIAGPESMFPAEKQKRDWPLLSAQGRYILHL